MVTTAKPIGVRNLKKMENEKKRMTLTEREALRWIEGFLHGKDELDADAVLELADIVDKSLNPDRPYSGLVVQGGINAKVDSETDNQD
jgi:hypothetical protein